METNRFESKCATCDERITTSNGGASWRHGKAPSDKHAGRAHGDMKQI